MQNIHVKRYKGDVGHWRGTIEPEDCSWILFVSKDHPPSLYLRMEHPVERECQEDHSYWPVCVVQRRDTGEELADEYLHQMGLTVRGSFKSPELLKEWDARTPHPAVLKAKEAVEEAMRVLQEEHEAMIGQPKK